MGEIRIIHTSDFHNRLTRAKAARLRELKDRHDALLIDTGDAILAANVCCLPWREPAIRLMNGAGYDAMGLGNREYFFRACGVEWKTGHAAFPRVASNVRGRDGAAVPGATTTLVVHHGSGARVGLFGLMPTMIAPGHVFERVSDTRFVPWQEAAREAADDLRERADVIVPMFHRPPEELSELVELCPEAPLVLAAHGHAERETLEMGGGVAVSHVGEGAKVARLIGLRAEDGTVTMDKLVSLGPAEDQEEAGMSQGSRKLLLVDIGNTGIHWAAHDGQFRAVGRLWTSQAKALAAEIGEHEPQVAVICSVVPWATARIAETLGEAGAEVVVLGETLVPSMLVWYDDQRELGQDRLANAAGAYQDLGGAAVIVDVGTAITVDAISGEGTFLGGAIAPGPKAAWRGLMEAVHGPSFAELDDGWLSEPPGEVEAIGRSTAKCLTAGLRLGYGGLVDRLVARQRQELGADAPVIWTGGAADLVRPYAQEQGEVDEMLTLKGLLAIYETDYDPSG